MTDLPVFCTLTPDALEQRRKETLENFRALIQETRSLEDGYALKFSAEDAILDELMRLIQLERKCCLFLRFELAIEPNGGPVWLELTGPEGTKTFLETELGLLP